MLVRHIPVAVLPIFLLFAIPQSLPAQPSEVSYQGELKKDGLPFTGTAQMKFVIVDGDDETIWSNDGTSTAGSEPTGFVSIETENGIFAVRLGAAPMEPISGGVLKGVTEVALRVWVNTGDGFEQLTDQPISSSAFSLSGEKCLEIGDLQINVVPRWDGTALVPGMLFDDGTNVGVGTSVPATKLDVSGIVRSSSGGFQFPDGTAQTTAVTGGGAGVPSSSMVLTATPEALNGFVSTGWSLQLLGTNSWRQRPSMPDHRWGLGVAAVGGKVFAFGGINGSTVKDVQCYDPLSNVWSERTDMPIALDRFGIAELDGFVYVIGGKNSSTTSGLVLRYDPANDTWTSMAPMLTPRFELSAVSLEGRIYAIGGDDDSNSSGLVEQFDPLTNEWTPKASLIIARRELTAAAVNGQIVSIGGVDTTHAITRTVEIYDPLVNEWTIVADFPVPVRGASATAINSRVYCFGGADDYSSFRRQVYEYEPFGQVWSSAPDMFSANSLLGTAALGSTIFAVGGFGNTNGCWEFVPPMRLFVQLKK